MIRLEQWLSDSRKQQVSLLFISTVILLYSIINLVVREKIISILFIILSLALFILSVLNRRTYRIQTKMLQQIRLIQKDYEGKKINYASLTRLNKKQKQLWQYIITDYSTDEIQYIFSLSPAALAKEIEDLFRIIFDN